MPKTKQAGLEPVLITPEENYMKLDVLGLFAACSYALDCVEAEFIHVTSKHARRVAYMSVCTAEQLGVQGKRPGWCVA